MLKCQGTTVWFSYCFWIYILIKSFKTWPLAYILHSRLFYSWFWYCTHSTTVEMRIAKGRLLLSCIPNQSRLKWSTMSSHLGSMWLRIFQLMVSINTLNNSTGITEPSFLQEQQVNAARTRSSAIGTGNFQVQAWMPEQRTAKHKGCRRQEAVRGEAKLAEADYKQPAEVLAVVLSSIATESLELIQLWHCGTEEGRKHPLVLLRIAATSSFPAWGGRGNSSSCTPTL